MKLSCLLAMALAWAGSALAQSASLTASDAKLDRAGGTITLTATANYDGQPAALGWSIVVPADWSLVSLAGPNLPAIAPQAGTTGTLEFAYTSTPAGQASFAVEVRYPAGVRTTVVSSSVILRAGGKMTTLTPERLTLRAPARPATGNPQP